MNRTDLAGGPGLPVTSFQLPEETIDKLVNNWQDYHIYYAGYKLSRASGIMFDPKNDDLKLLGDWWAKIESKESLDFVLKWIDWSPAEPHPYGLNL